MNIALVPGQTARKMIASHGEYQSSRSLKMASFAALLLPENPADYCVSTGKLESLLSVGPGMNLTQQE